MIEIVVFECSQIGHAYFYVAVSLIEYCDCKPQMIKLFWSILEFIYVVVRSGHPMAFSDDNAYF